MKKPGLAFAYFRAWCLDPRRRRNETLRAGYPLAANSAVSFAALAHHA
jgi:hypothetical protein